MKRLSVGALILAVILVFSSSSHAQGFYSMGSGSYMTGYGQVYGSFGSAMATQRMYQTVQLNMQRSMARAAMVKKWGEAAVRKAEAEAGQKSSAGTPKNVASSNPQIVVPPPPPAPKYYGKYLPDSSVNMAVTISNTLFEKPEERNQLKQVIDVVQAAYKEEAAKKGWNNNVASGMTFFLISMATVYQDAPEPDDATTDAVYEAVNQAIDAVPEFATASNKDKTTINDMLVGFTALPLATYMEGKQSNNQESVAVAKALAGEMIKLVLKIEPGSLKFDSKSLKIG